MKLFLIIGILLLGLTLSCFAAKPKEVPYKNKTFCPIVWQAETKKFESPKRKLFDKVLSSKVNASNLQRKRPYTIKMTK